MKTDNDALHRTHDLWSVWRELPCRCVMNDAGFKIRYCGPDNPKRGTHWGRSP